MSSYEQQSQDWYQQGYNYGYNQENTFIEEGGSTGNEITMPYDIPPQWQSLYHQGMDAGDSAAAFGWSGTGEYA